MRNEQAVKLAHDSIAIAIRIKDMQAFGYSYSQIIDEVKNRTPHTIDIFDKAYIISLCLDEVSKEQALDDLLNIKF